MEKLKPLVVDLDGTLIKSDLLIESLFLFLKSNIFNFLVFIRYLFKGKSQLKSKIASVVDIDVSVLPYNNDVLDYIVLERKKGRKIILATASNIRYANQISDFTKAFDLVLASDKEINLASKVKAKRLVEQFGEKGFDYIGNSEADIQVWEKASEAIVVNPDRGVLEKARRIANVSKIIDTRPSFLRTLVKALRVHQWAKNVLIFVPLAASHYLMNFEMLTTVLFAFLIFSLCASTVYLLNDLLDLEDDRHHKTKCNRPFASGDLDVRFGIFAVPLILLAVFVLSIVLLPPNFFFVLLSYYLLTLAYSFKLKKMVMVDVITLAMLYTVRIVAGGVVLGLELTFWLLAFSMFIFLSLAMVKRYAELYEAKQLGLTKTRGRGYQPSDLELLSSLGTASGYLSVLVLSLYINEPLTASMYHYPTLIWAACPLLLFWISRTWIVTHRGLMNDDPVVFALKDRVSQIVGVLFILVFWMAI
ncbi:Decaprenyl-phosphate phosphoribosyltransferase [Vibrio thalassae]|uniref:Decaprenyl-phosphate phosphoribosyltransferase n=1 Tax=Vibrio thalassae TaxID=1243014 RepID=A0A240EMC6_9VIBR|nr:UbiA family prenyltransferase [Vibrio thalassae]SNX49766.1 Decaprenyl-phosphate phosphoribosyltransferase [Vibrio thalassae]